MSKSYLVKYTGYYKEVAKYNPYKLDGSDHVGIIFIIQSLQDKSKIFGASKRELQFIGYID